MANPFDINAAAAAKVGGSIITNTLDVLNSGQFSGSGNKCSGASSMSGTYDLSKSVLSSVYQGKGAVVSAKG